MKLAQETSETPRTARRLLWLALAVAACTGSHIAQAATPEERLASRWVDPFIGTDGTGHTFPGATVPFGMVAPSPDNSYSGWAYASGYQYRAPRIQGFSNSHMSGTGIADLGDVLLQPSVGRRWTEATLDFSRAYLRKTESATPGYYAVKLLDNQVVVELTATQRVALQRYTFKQGGHVQVLVDVQHVLHYLEGPRVTDSNVTVDEKSGTMQGRTHLVNWTARELVFAVQFSQPIAQMTPLPARTGEKAPRYLLDFELAQSRVLEVRVALSTVDPVGARNNLNDAQGRSFNAVRHDADAAWEQLLSRLDIDVPSRQRRIFYTALYHALLHPSDIADADGRVRGPTGTIGPARGGHYYSTLSLWDVSRAQFPLLALLVPERVDDIVNSLLQHQQAQGYLPLFAVWGGETWCMIGNPSLPIIAHAVSTGFHGFDWHEALNAMVTTSTAPRPSAPEWAQHDWDVYEKYGFLPFDKVKGEAVS